MQRFFTKNFILLVLSFVSINLMGQSLNTLTINSPAGIAGDYVPIRASFGSVSNTPITANASFAADAVAPINDGCTELVNSLTGTIGFVDRGVCSFVIKAALLQAKGAIAVIICQNSADAPFSAGGTDPNVTVPVFMISKADCDKIRVDIIAGGVNVSLRNTCKSTATFGPNAIWGKVSGEGDFTGGLNAWTVDKMNTWEWNPEGNITKGAYGGTTMVSGTACSGIASMNSDFLDNTGSQTGGGTGLCPAPCRGALISPNISLAGMNIKGLTIEFNQTLRQFRSEFYLIVSKDGGITWPDTNRFNTEYPINSSVINNTRLKVALRGYAGATQIRFKFDYVGNYYYWGIDDVVVNNEAYADTKVNENFYAGAPSLRVPANQVSPMPFLADVSNIGNLNATNVKLDVTITNRATPPVEVGKFTNNYGAMAAGSITENKPFTEQFTPPAVPGTYDGKYVIRSTEDTSGVNNTVNFFFEVTDKTFGNLLPEAVVTPANYLTYVLAPWTVGTTVTYYSAGNIYYVKDGNGKTIDKVRFGLANVKANIVNTGFVRVDVYKWIDLDGDNECNPLEREKIGTNSIFLEDNIANLRNIELPIWALDSEGNSNEGVEVDLKSNTTYIVIAHTEPLDPSVERYQLLGYPARALSSFDRSVNYSAVTYAFDTLHIERNAGSLFGLTGTSVEDVTDRNFEIVQNGVTQSTAFLEMDMKQAVGTYDVNDKAIVSTFPNPASRELYIDLTLTKASQNVMVDLMGMDGKLVLTKQFGNVLDSRLKLDLDNVISGAYSLVITTNEGTITKKVMVQK